MTEIMIKNAFFKSEQDVYFENITIPLSVGTWTCLLGTSGIGKTTLLKIMAGLLLTSEKTIKAGADMPSDLPLRISYLPQKDLLLPWFTVLENVLLSCKLRGDKQDHHEKALALLTEVGLSDVSKAKPYELSGGMRQRVALARVLMEDKPIVLMDEPFSALDAATRFKMQNLALSLLKGKTVLFVTHDPLEALRLANHIYVMAQKPVKLIPVVVPEEPIPRDITDIKILKIQSQILQWLM